MSRSITSRSGARIAAFALLCFVHAWAACAFAQTLANVHRSSGGIQANAGADFNGSMSISDDALYVTFCSWASNLDPADTNPGRDVYVRNLATGATVLITRDTAGGPINGDVVRPWISGNGRYVVYQSDATDLVAGDVNGTNDIFRHDRDTDADGIFDEPGATATILVSLNSAGAQANGPSRCYRQSVSDDGNRVVFESGASNLVGDDTNFDDDCFLRDVALGTTVRVSVSSAGAQSDCSTQAPAISGDGLSVAFQSSFMNCNLTPGDSPEADVYVRNVALGTTTLVSVNTAGGPANSASFWPTLSDDGDRVAFESWASDLVPGDLNMMNDVFVRILSSGTTVRASVMTGGGEASGTADDAFISGDGTRVSYTSSDVSPLLETNGVDDVFVRDLAANLTARASRPLAGGEGNGRSYYHSLSEDGEAVVFASQATNLDVPDSNGGDLAGLDVFVRSLPLTSPDVIPPPPPPPPPTPGPAPGSVDDNPVTFSVNGPVDPHTEGIRDARGAATTPQLPALAGDPIAFGVRSGFVPQAAGFPTIRPGDVFDYVALPFPSEAAVFQSMPPVLPLFPEGAAPDGTNNQINEAIGAGLMAGPGILDPMFWTMLPPDTVARDNIDALSFGEDYFPMVAVGIDSSSMLPAPPPGVAVTPWSTRVSVYAEPIVVSDPPGISFRFSVDPWAMGLAGTSLAAEAAPGDVGAGLGPWTSGGDAADDVFSTPVLMRVGGVTVAGGTNALTHDNPTLALAAPLDPMEDDLDALECVGENTNWITGEELRPGNGHGRMTDVGVDLPAPMVSAHEPNFDTPVFFSVTRNSPGVAGSAVRSQFVIDGGAASDIFVMVPTGVPGVGNSLLFIDEAELGLLSLDASPGGTGMMDYTDDLDGLILRVCPEYRAFVSEYIKYLVESGGGPAPWSTYMPGTGAYTGGGMTISVTKMLYGMLPPGCIQVGFSVTTDAIGLEFTGVDYEAGPVFPAGGTSTASGDIFYASISGAAANRNYLWYEGMDLGQDEGGWVNGASMDLADLSDNLNALDSIDSASVLLDVAPSGGGVPRGTGIELASAAPNPFRTHTVLRYRTAHEGHVRVTVHDLAGRVLETIEDAVLPSGEHRASWAPARGGSARVHSGIYFVRASLDGVVRSTKVIYQP